MKAAKVSLVITVFNEEKNIRKLIDSIVNQSVLPSELIIVDGQSRDNTLTEIKTATSAYRNKFKIKVLIKKGNRSIGRNEGIKKASYKIILLTDAGCFLDKKWIENITKPFQDKKIEVVSGYYEGIGKTIFQKCLIPYVLVMKDKINQKEFLPATRSMAFRKYVWKKIGGFDKSLSHNEDYDFANRIKEKGFNIYFQQSAIINWIPRKNIKESFVMFLRFAFGDGEAGIIRNKVLLIFARYLFYIYLISILILIKSLFLLVLSIFLPIIYICWSIKKNYKYVKNKKALIYLPIIQIVSDIAVLLGTAFGLIKFISKQNFKSIVKNNIFLIVIITIYSISMLSVIKSGIPNLNHPFPYQMDEWHQLQSIRNVFKFGTPNLAGSANGTMFHFFYSGILLTSFIVFKIINPMLIKSAVDSIDLQNSLFILLRLNTLFFGVFTLIVISKIAKLIKLNSNLAVLLFFITPMWLSLSNFFKYDIALVFWITLSMYFLIKYYYFPSPKNILFGSLFAGIAFSVKVTGLTMFPVIIIAYLLFTPSVIKKYLYLFSSIVVFIITSVFLGMPDVFFGGRSMYLYLYENIVGISLVSKNFQLGDSLFNINFLHKFPGILGHPLYILTIIAVIYFFISLLINLVNFKYKDLRLRVFLLISFLIFLLSLFSLGIFITANRAIVLLPFVIILNLLVFKDLLIYFKNNVYVKASLILFFSLLLCIQIFESYLWLAIKNLPLPQQLSSTWVVNNIPAGSNIGLENIPIYQFEPDFVTKEFYSKQYHPTFKTAYNYSVINNQTRKLPKYIIVSNVEFEQKYLISSSKNDLVKRLKKEGYLTIGYFPLKIPFYNIFDSNFDYPFMGLTTYPQSISIFRKDLK